MRKPFDIKRAHRQFWTGIKATLFLLGCLLVCWAALKARAQGQLVARMPDSATANIVTPRALVALTGEEWQESAAYRIEIDSLECQIVRVTSEAILFLVADAVRPSFADRAPRTLLIQGPQRSHFLDLIVKPYYPMIRQQAGFAVGIATPNMFPVFYTEGAPLPVGPVSILASGILTGREPIEAPFQPLVILTNETTRLEIFGEAWPFPLFYADERVSFTAPPCLNGEYQARIAYGPALSEAAPIRFTSNCAPAPRAPRKLRKA